MLRAIAVGLACVFAASSATAQQSPTAERSDISEATIRSPILVLDRVALYRDSTFGQAFQASLIESRDALNAENRAIDAAFRQEELDLTDRRATLEAEEFRALAADFDERVRVSRRRQDAKEQALIRLVDERQRDFEVAIRPILGALMGRAGSVAVIERDAVFLFFDGIDITDEARTAIDNAFSDGRLKVVDPQTP